MIKCKTAGRGPSVFSSGKSQRTLVAWVFLLSVASGNCFAADGNLRCGFRELYPSAYPAERLEIRLIEPSDRDAYLNVLRNDGLRSVQNNRFDDAEAEANFNYLMSQQNTYDWTARSYGLFLKNENRLVGVVEFFDRSRQERSAYVGFALLPELWHNGFGREAVSSVIQQAPSLLHFDILRAGASQADAETNAALRQAGFRKVGEGTALMQGRPARGNFYELRDFPDPYRDTAGDRP